MHQRACTLSVWHKIRQFNSASGLEDSGKNKTWFGEIQGRVARNRPHTTSHSFQEYPPGLYYCISRYAHLLFWVSLRYHVNNSRGLLTCRQRHDCVCAYAQSRLRGQVMYRFHKLHLVCSRAHFLHLYNRKLFCSLNLGVIREGTKSEKENKWTGRRFGIALRLGINFNESWVGLSFCEGLFEKVSLNSKSHAMLSENHTRKTFV